MKAARVTIDNQNVTLGWLTKRADYLALQAPEVKRCHTPFFVMQVRPQPVATGYDYRVGFTTSRKLGDAVMRNRARRRLRDLVRRHLATEMRAGFDVVLIGRTAAATAPFALLKQHLRQAVQRLKVSKES